MNLDDRFAALRNCPVEKAHSALSLFNVQNALEFDIARQYLMGFPVEELAKHNQLATLRKIIESGAKYKRVRLGDYLRLNTDRIKPSDSPDIRFRVLGVSNTEGVFLNETKPGAEINQTYYCVKPKEFCYNPYRVNVGSIGLNEFDYDNQIISGAYNVFGTDETELLPPFLMALFKSPQFLAYVNEKAHGGVRMNFKFEDLEEWDIPLPPVEKQAEIAGMVYETEAFSEAIKNVVKLWRIDPALFRGEERDLPDICQLGTGSTPPRNNPEYFNGNVKWILTTEISENEITDSTEMLTEKAVSDCNLRIYPSGTVLLAMYGQGQTRGRTALLQCDAAITQNSVALVPDTSVILSKYLFYNLQARYEEIRGQEYSGGGVPHLNTKIISQLRIPVPSVSEQKIIVVEIDKQRSFLNSLNQMREAAVARSKRIVETSLEGFA